MFKLKKKTIKDWLLGKEPTGAIVICDYCGLNVSKQRDGSGKPRFRFTNWGCSYGEVNGYQLCIPCYEIERSKQSV